MEIARMTFKIVVACLALASLLLNVVCFAGVLMLFDRTDELAATDRACGRVQWVQTQRIVDLASAFNMIAGQELFKWERVERGDR